MARRLVPALALLVTLVASGCDYGTSASLTDEQRRARLEFIDENRDLTDRQLARLCPGLYPRDFLDDTEKWPAAKLRDGDRDRRFSADELAAARAAGCDIRPGR